VAQAERHHGELGLPRQLELGDRRELLVQVPGQVELLVQRRAERVHPVQHQREPHAQTAEVAREFRGILGEIGKLVLRREVLQVRGADEMRLAQARAVARDERTRPVRQEQPPVAAPRDRVRRAGPRAAAAAAISAIGSIAPVLVVPADATTKNGVRPAERSATTISRSASTSLRGPGGPATERTFALGNPAIAAAFALGAWTCSET